VKASSSWVWRRWHVDHAVCKIPDSHIHTEDAALPARKAGSVNGFMELLCDMRLRPSRWYSGEKGDVLQGLRLQGIEVHIECANILSFASRVCHCRRDSELHGLVWTQSSFSDVSNNLELAIVK
jgi:hypothetical protein